MSAYHVDEAMFELGEGWIDRSVQMLGRPGPDGTQLGLVITREPLPEGSNLGALVEKQVAEQSRELVGHALLGVRESTIDGALAYEVKYTWEHEAGRMFHYHASVAAFGTLLVLTASSLARAREACELEMERVLATLRFRER